MNEDIEKSIDILSYDRNKVTLINPDGNKITLDIEDEGDHDYGDSEHGYYGTSYLGQDETYAYTFYVEEDEHGYHFEIEDWDWQTIEEKEAEDLKYKKLQDENLKKHKHNTEKANIEEYEKIKKSGLSKDDYYTEKWLKEVNGEKGNSSGYIYIPHDQIDLDLIDGSLAVVIIDIPEYYEGKIETIDQSYYLVPIGQKMLDRKASDLFGEDFIDMFNITDATKNNVKNDIKEKGLINTSRNEEFRDVISLTSFISNFPRIEKYIDRIPQYVNITRFTYAVHK